MSRVQDEPSDRIAHLRGTLLTGRGPGASDQEIADNTRNRPTLGAATASDERTLAGRQADHPRTGEPISGARGRSHVRSNRRRWALVGAVSALVARSIGIRLLRSRHAPHR